MGLKKDYAKKIPPSEFKTSLNSVSIKKETVACPSLGRDRSSPLCDDQGEDSWQDISQTITDSTRQPLYIWRPQKEADSI